MYNVPGRKTDVSDSAWIARLVEHGLVRASFVPPSPIRRLRDLTRIWTDVVFAESIYPYFQRLLILGQRDIGRITLD